MRKTTGMDRIGYRLASKLHKADKMPKTKRAALKGIERLDLDRHKVQARNERTEQNYRASLRKQLKAQGKSSLEIQAALIDAGLLQDVRVKGGTK